MTRSLANMRAHRRILSCLLLATYLPACSSWHVGTPTPAEFITNEKPQHVRVTGLDGFTFDLGAPEIRGDSLRGTVGGGLARGDTASTISIPLSGVQSVAVKRASTGKTLLLVGGGLVAFVAIVAVIACTGSNSDFYNPC